ncbi:MAG: SDR family oxidoreductase [Vicingaceae bacterium]
MNVVVSGASSGIGRAVVENLDQAGHQVLAIARSEGSLNELQEQTQNTQRLAVDLGNEQSKAIVSDFIKSWGRVDVLINNAGQLINKPFLECTSEDFTEQFQANVLSAVHLTQACFPYMNKKAHIVNISSMGGFQGSSKYPGLSAYSSTKGALAILSECLSGEFSEYQISVNALALGAVETEMLQKAFPGVQAPLSAKQMAAFISDFALNGNTYYNGQVIPVALSNP